VGEVRGILSFLSAFGRKAERDLSHFREPLASSLQAHPSSGNMLRTGTLFIEIQRSEVESKQHPRRTRIEDWRQEQAERKKKRGKTKKAKKKKKKKNKDRKGRDRSK
jgi:hypothetical protein